MEYYLKLIKIYFRDYTELRVIMGFLKIRNWITDTMKRPSPHFVSS